MSNYTNLHVHSEASVADGLFHPRKWVQAFRERGIIGSAMTDHGTMVSLLPFYKLMRAEKKTPLMGAEFYFVDDPTEKTADNRKNSHLILIAKDYQGWRNLCKLSELSFTEGMYYKPRIGYEWLAKYGEGLVCLTACQGGVLSNQVWAEKKGRTVRGLEETFFKLKAIFEDDLYVEFQGHNTISKDDDGEEFDSQAMINQAFYERLRNLSGFKHVVTNDCHYILPEHANIQRSLKEASWSSGGGTATGDSATVTKDHFTDSLWLKSPVQIYESFRKHHEYLPKQFVADGMLQTMEVFEKCKDFALPEGKRYLPTFRKGVDSKALFKKITTKALEDFLASDKMRATRKEYITRFVKEFKVISKYNLEDYFLVVWDIVRFAKSQGIYTGIGRGSAAGCLISYLLDIVKIDPLEFKLIFERFLNEDRCKTGELADIDLDFETDRRRDIKEYIYKTYGAEYVCEIGTYGRMKMKTALIDFAKSMGIARQQEILAITTKLDLDKEDVEDIDVAAESDPKLARLLEANPDYKFAVEEIMGQMKSQGVHPAGVIICSEPIASVTPVKTQKKTLKPEEMPDDYKKKDTEIRVVTTQAEDKYLIEQGFMKVDVLGVKEYDVVRYIVENADTPFTFDNYAYLIQQQEREKPNKKVWKMFQAGRSEAVFQFASQGMKSLLTMMQPDCIEDLVAANALYRPACLENGWHIKYCDRKQGTEEISFIHPDVEASLGDTHGIIVYQEQVMEVMNRLGGIPLVDADTIRSALGKKDKEKLGKFKKRFVEGASTKIPEAEASALWDQLEKAASYGFNRCVSGRERFYRNHGPHGNLTIGDMWRAANDLDWAKLNNKVRVRHKYRGKQGYGLTHSMIDGRLLPNRIVDIRNEGLKHVFEVTVESGAKIVVTMNHKFPTPDGIKMLMQMEVGDLLYVNDGYEKTDSTFRFGGTSNLPRKGQMGFQTKGATNKKLFDERRIFLKTQHDFCQVCLKKMLRKEMHHIDGDHGNQGWENLIIVCPSCHKKAHYKMGRRKKGEKGYTVRAERIVGINYLGEEEVFDVEMEAPNHNFVVSSGIVTCNSHAAAYAVLAYISQYLKVEYPAQFWAGQLDRDTRKGKTEDMLVNRRAATEMGIEFVLPHINRSKLRFGVVGVEVVWSFLSVKGIGFKAAKHLESLQPYEDFEDFYSKIDKRIVKNNNIQSLIYAGALDSFGDRRELLKILEAKKRKKGTKYVGESDEELMKKFHASMGFFEMKIKKVKGGFSKYCITESELIECDAGDAVRCGGMITEVRAIRTKKGKNMGFVTLMDLDEMIEVTVFPEDWSEHREKLRVNNIVEIHGKKSDYNGKQNLLEFTDIDVK